MSKEAMQPCPFCGTEPWGIFGPSDDTGRWWVECHGPDVNTGCGDWHFQPEEEQDRAKARAEVAAAWNRRAALSLLRAELEAGGEAEPVAWIVFAQVEGQGMVAQYPARFTPEECERDRRMYSATVKTEVRALYASPVAADTQGDANDRELARELADYFRVFTKSSHLFHDGRPLHVVTVELLDKFAAPDLTNGKNE